MKKEFNVLMYCGIFLFMFCGQVYCQFKVIDSSAEAKPSWVNETPTGKAYTYYSSMGSSNTSLQQAQENAIGGILQRLVEEGTFNVSIESTTETSESIHTSSGKTQHQISDDFIREVVLTGTSKTISGLQKEEDYWQTAMADNGTIYQYWVLFRLSKPGVDLSLLRKTGYGFSPVWRSAILPGWGQLYKKEKKKGKLLLAGFTLSIATAVTSQSLSSNYAIDAENADTGEWVDYYNTISEQYFLASTISYILAGTIYGYSAYDAISSEGAKIYASSDDTGLYLTFTQANGLIPQLKLSINI